MAHGPGRHVCMHMCTHTHWHWAVSSSINKEGVQLSWILDAKLQKKGSGLYQTEHIEMGSQCVMSLVHPVCEAVWGQNSV